jgi:hypothetical protein
MFIDVMSFEQFTYTAALETPQTFSNHFQCGPLNLIKTAKIRKRPGKLWSIAVGH